MPNTAGYEVVAELTRASLQQILEGAWDNAIVPHSVDVAPGTAFGPYQLADGVVNVPRAGLRLDLAPPDAVRVTLAVEAQAEVANPPIPSAAMFAVAADVAVRVPLGTLPGTIHVAALLDGIPRANVAATVTSGDPIPALTAAAVEEYVHARYRDGTIPDHVEQPGVSFGGVTADAWVDVYDDSSKPTHRITVSQPTATTVRLLIPVHLKLSNVSAPAPSPMGVVAKLAVAAGLEVVPGQVTARLSTATVTLEDFAPAPVSDAAGSYDGEGANFSLASGFAPGLEPAVRALLAARGEQLVHAVGDVVVVVPTLAQIEAFIADQVHAALQARGNIPLWTPTPPPGGEVTVRDVRPVALADALAIGINDAGAADPAAITNFIPAGRSCAIAISGAKVLQIIDEQIHRPESEGGFGPDFPPKTFTDVDGHDARLTSLDVSLADGFIRIRGDVTVVDAIAGKIDVDASFEAHSGLRWTDNPDGTQLLEPFLLEEPDVDLSLLAWILSFLVGFITFGLVGGIVALVVLSVVDDLAERIGGAVVRDEVTGQVKGVGAWPQTLEGIGEVTSRFENPVVIDPDGIMFPDGYEVTALFAGTTDALAEANGPYAVPEGAPVRFVGGPARPNTTYAWAFGDGGTAATAEATHAYADDGLYVAKLTTVVHEPGGVTTRQFAAVRVTNVPPAVDVWAPLVVPEGRVVELAATFTDPGWADAHTAVFDFGDNSPPVAGVVTETNAAPAAAGTARATHAYCDDGAYVVTVRVRDDDGGIGVGRGQVTVQNVPPTVEAGPDVFAYPCTPVTLVARFTDPGWCDTHAAVWDFGDCTPPFPATVRERHEPPEGCGIAAATHVYGRCGAYHAVCTVADDDGGVGTDALVVRVVDVRNRRFEDGFRTTVLGVVANEWEPYAAVAGTAAGAAPADGARFAAEEFVVHDGQRAQRVAPGRPGGQREPGGAAGLWQLVGANPGWDYQCSAWYHVDARGEGVCRLGVDAAGGQDPRAATVTWSEGRRTGAWEQLSVRATATGRAVTLFLEYDAGPRGAGAWFDEVALVPYPCPLGEAPPCRPPRQKREQCVTWREERRPRVLGMHHERDGFRFTALDPRQPLRVVTLGEPVGEGKLQFPRKGVEVTLPFAAGRVTADVVSGTQEPVHVVALDAAGAAVAQQTTAPGAGVPHTVVLRAGGMRTFWLTGGGGEGLLVRLCAAEEDDDAPPSAPEPKLPRPAVLPPLPLSS